MPDIAKIDRFKKKINSLGNEENILKERGQSVSDVTPPEAGIDADLSDFLSFQDDAPAAAKGSAPGPSSSATAFFDELTSDLNLDSDSSVEDDFLRQADEAVDTMEDVIEGQSEETGFDASPDVLGDDIPLPGDDFFSSTADFNDEAESDGADTGFSADEQSFGAENFEMPDFGDTPVSGINEAPADPTEVEQSDNTGEEDFSFPDNEIEQADFSPDAPADFSEPEGESLGDDILGESDFESVPDSGTDFASDFSMPEDFSESQSLEVPSDAGMDALASDFSADEPDQLPDESMDFQLPDDLSSVEMPDLGNNKSDDLDSFSVEEESPTQEMTQAMEDEFDLPSGFPFNAQSGEGETQDVQGNDSDALGDFDLGESKEIDDFNLGDLGSQFGYSSGLESGADAEEDMNPAMAVGAEDLDSAVEKEGFSQDEFEQIQQNLHSLPKNLRIAIEELIGTGNLQPQTESQILQMLIDGEAPRVIASAVSRITGKLIKIPKGYQKLSWAQLEAQRNSFAYRFQQNILPVMIPAFLIVLGLGVLGALGYFGVYKPLHALSLFDTGYKNLQKKEWTSAEEYFTRGWNEFAFKDQFYRYAEGYTELSEIGRAVKKYEDLLVMYPKDIKGLYDFGKLESTRIYDFDKAQELFDKILDIDRINKKALIASGHNQLDKAEEDPTAFAQAQKYIGRAADNYGQKGEIAFLVLRYFIRMDMKNEVDLMFSDIMKTKQAETDAQALAELAGYYIDKNVLDDIEKILTKAAKKDPSEPEIYYNEARFARLRKQVEREKMFLNQALALFEKTAPHRTRKLKQFIDTYARIGEVFLNETQALAAESYLVKGINLYETSLDLHMLKPDPMFGRMYKNLGDVYYYLGADMDKALAQYSIAEKNMYITADLKYKKGNIYYYNEDYENAVTSFYMAENYDQASPIIKFSLANTLFSIGEYYAAEGYYEFLFNELDARYNAILRLEVQDSHEQRILINNLRIITNNLGAAIYATAGGVERKKKTAEALSYFTQSSEYFDILRRDYDTGERATSGGYPLVDQAQLNFQQILHPFSGREVSIFVQLPMDLTLNEF